MFIYLLLMGTMVPLLLCLLCAQVVMPAALTSLVLWEYQVMGDVEFVSAEESEGVISVVGNYRGSLNANDPFFHFSNSSESNDVSSGIILVFEKDNANVPQLIAVSTISANYFTTNLMLHQVAISKSQVIVTGITGTSAVTLNHNDSSNVKSIVVGAIGNFVAVLDFTGEFRHFARIPRACEDPIYCILMETHVSQIGKSAYHIATTSNVMNTMTNTQQSRVVLYRLPPSLDSSSATYNLKDTLPLNPVAWWNFECSASDSEVVIVGITVDENREKILVSGYTERGTVALTTANGTEAFHLQAIGEHKTSFLIEFPLEIQSANNISEISIISQQFGEFGNIAQDNSNHLAVLTSTTSKTDYQLFELTTSGAVNVQIPQPVLQLYDNGEQGYVHLFDLVADPVGSIFISGYSTSSVEFGVNATSTMEVAEGEEGIFIAKYDSTGSFAFMADLVTSRGSQVSLPSVVISQSGELFCTLNNRADLTVDALSLSAGASLLLIGCSEQCHERYYCSIEENPTCQCSPDFQEIGGQCYANPCPSDCSSHGSCSYEYGYCECDDGYLSPDCSRQVIREPYEDYFTNSAILLGNMFQTTSGNIVIMDYTSLPDVGWSYVVGTFSGKAVFGDVSLGDHVTETITCLDGETGSFIAMYDHRMKLQWIVSLRTLLPNSNVAITSTTLQPSTNQLIITGYISGDVNQLRAFRGINEIYSQNITRSSDVPPFFGRIDYTGEIDWFDAAPLCSASGPCEWQAAESQPVLAITNQYLVVSTVAVHKAPEGSGAADRNYFMLLKYDMTSATMVLLGQIGDCTNTGDTSELNGIIVQGDHIILSGHFHSYSARFYDINQPESNILTSQSSPASFLLRYSLDTMHLEKSFVNNEASAEAFSVGLRSDPNQSVLWFVFIRPGSSHSVELGANVISLDLEILASAVISVPLPSDVKWNEEMTLERLIDVVVNPNGDILFLSVHRETFYLKNGLSLVGNDETVITPSSHNEKSYYLSSFCSAGTPLWATAITLSRDSADTQVGYFSVDRLSRVRLDALGRIRVMGSLQQELPVSWHLNLGLLASLDGKQCNGCSDHGWCYFGAAPYGECVCELSSFGARCESSLLLPFSNYLNWSQRATILSPEEGDYFSFYGIHMDSVRDVLYVTGSQRGDVSYQPFLGGTPTLAVHLPSRLGDGFVASMAPASGFMYWIAYVSTSRDEANCRITQVDVERFDGIIFVSGWAPAGTLRLFHGQSPGTMEEREFTSFEISASGGAFVGQLHSNGTWMWAEAIHPRDYCVSSGCAPPEGEILTDFWDTFVDLRIYSSRQYGGVELYVGGTYYTRELRYDAFVRRYNLLNAHARPMYVWDVIGKSLDTTHDNTGQRGTRSLSVLPAGDIIAGGYWTAPSLQVQDGEFAYHQLSSQWATDPSIRFRWTLRVNPDGQVVWLRANDIPSAVFTIQSELYDTAVSSNGEEVWLCVNEASYAVNATTMLPTHFYDTKSGSVTLLAASGNDYVNSALAVPLEVDEGAQRDDILFFSIVVDPQDNIIAGGHYRERGMFSASSYMPQVRLESEKESQSAVIASWDEYGNLQYIMQSYYGTAQIHRVYSDTLGNLFVTGEGEKGVFFDGVYMEEASSFLLSFSACENNCHFNGICIFGSYGAPGRCACNEGWEGPYCDTPICTGDPPCQGRGECVAPNICDCETGWAAPTCEECASGFQPPSCTQCLGGLAWPECTECTSSHLLPPDCTSCVDGWMPPGCETCAPGYQLPDCKECKSGYLPPYCGECREGFYSSGFDCISSCADPHFMPPDCQTCIEPYAGSDCRCEHGYTGNHCDQYTCWEIHDCNDHGVCSGANECFCEGGYEGAACDIAPDYSAIAVVFTNLGDNKTMIAAASQSILLDASPSADLSNPNALLYYEWDCRDTTFPSLACPLATSELLSSEAKQLIPAYALISGHTYIWKVTVRSGNQYSSDTMRLDLSSHSVPSIDVTVTPPGELFSSATILVTATASEEIISWTWLSLDSKVDIATLRITSSPESSVLQLPPQTVIGTSSLYVAGTTEDGRVGSKVQSLSITATTLGYCSSTPYDTGMAISTEFTLFCSSWHDITGANSRELSYQFSYFDENSIQVFFSPVEKQASHLAYLPYQSSPCQIVVYIYSSQLEIQNSFSFTIRPSSYMPGTLSSQSVSQRMEEAQLVALNWPQVNLTASCNEPLCALNILAALASVPVYTERPDEMPTVEQILDILIPLMDNSEIEMNNTYVSVFTSVLFDLALRKDAEFDALYDIGNLFLRIATALREANTDDMIDAQDPLVCPRAIITALDYWLRNRLDHSASSDQLRLLIREIISQIQHSLASEAYLSCTDPSITISTSSIVISVSRGTLSDLKTSARVSLSYKSATFLLPDDLESLVITDSDCLFWHRGAFSPLLYPYEESECIQWATELTILSSDGAEEQFVDFSSSPLIISFPLSTDCPTNHEQPVCLINNKARNDLSWISGGCVFIEDLGAKIRFSVTVLSDFTLAYVYSSSPVQHSSNPISSKSSSLLTLDSPLPEESSNDSASTLSSGEVGMGKVWFWTLLFSCMIIGAIVVIVLFAALRAARRGVTYRNQNRVKEFAMEMEEFRFDEDEGGEGGEEGDNGANPVNNAIRSISNLISRSKTPPGESDSTLVKEDEKQIEKEEQVYVFSEAKKTSKGKFETEDNFSLFCDPDDDANELLPNPSKKEKKSENTRLVVEAANLSDQDEDENDDNL